jgi:hypothetical protein
MVQSRDLNKIWRCITDESNELRFGQWSASGEVSEQVVSSGAGGARLSWCGIVETSSGAPLIWFYEGDFEEWIALRAQPKLKLAWSPSSGEWQQLEIAEGWPHYIQVVAATSDKTTHLLVPELVSRSPYFLRTRELVWSDGIIVKEQGDIVPLPDRPSFNGSLQINRAGQLFLAHSKNDNQSFDFALYLSRRTNNRWVTHLIHRSLQGGYVGSLVTLLPHPHNLGDVTMLFNLLDTSLNEGRVRQVTWVDGEVQIQELYDEDDSVIISANAAMGPQGELHLLFKSAASDELRYKVIR